MVESARAHRACPEHRDIHVHTVVRYETRISLREACTLLDSHPTVQFGRRGNGGHNHHTNLKRLKSVNSYGYLVKQLLSIMNEFSISSSTPFKPLLYYRLILRLESSYVLHSLLSVVTLESSAMRL